MCDLYSWGVVNYDIPAKGLKTGDVIFLTDAEIESKFDATLPEDVRNYIGHSAIANYYGIDDDQFTHHESDSRIPVALAKEVNLGHCRRMAASVGSKPVPYNIPIGDDFMERESVLHDITCAHPIRPDYLRRILKKLREITFSLPNRTRAQKREIWAFVKDSVISGADPFGTRSGRNIAGLIDACIKWGNAPFGRGPYECIHRDFEDAVISCELD